MNPKKANSPSHILARLFRPREYSRAQLAAVTSQVDDSSGWMAFQGGPHDRDASEIQQQYADALEAWRKNPIAKRIVDCITDYVLGDGMTPSAAGNMGDFIDRWWNHEQNNMDRRLPELSDELTRSGDLFLTLHRNPVDGISYIRPIPKDSIMRIETLPNDWETETAYYDTSTTNTTREIRRWLSPSPSHRTHTWRTVRGAAITTIPTIATPSTDRDLSAGPPSSRHTLFPVSLSKRATHRIPLE